MTQQRNEIVPERLSLAAADTPAIREVPFDAPWAWLAAGWRDLWRVPHVSLSYGALFALAALALSLGLSQVGAQSLILALAGGFLLVGPLLAVGLYETSRRLALGLDMNLSDVLLAGLRSRGQLGFMGVVLLLIFFAWVEIAFLLLMLFLGGNGLPPPSDFVPALLFTRAGLGLLIVGSLAGGALAMLVFSVSVISVPLLLERKIDVVTASLTSIKTVVLNPQAMLLWAALIAGFVALGVATVFAGLVIVFPLVGHATWHAYRDLVVD